MKSDNNLSRHLQILLQGHGAHLDYESAVKDFPVNISGSKIPNVTHTPWRLLEHIRIAQWDILEFCKNPDHVSPKFPEGYWPKADAPSDNAAWNQCINDFLRDLREMQNLITDPTTDLFAKIPHGDGQTILREALVVADHNAYHLGQLMMIRKYLGA